MPNDTKTLNKAISLYGLNGVHPAADIVPMMGDEDYRALVEDTRANGFLNPVRVTKERLLIDGRNRLCASVDIGLDVSIEEYTPSNPVQYVVSENVKRRHLTVGQRAMIGTAIEEYYAVEAKERQRAAGGDRKSEEYQKSLPMNSSKAISIEPSRKRAADAVNVGEDSIQKAKKIKTVAPDLADEVMRNERSLHNAYQEARQREQAKPLTAPTLEQEYVTLYDHKGNEVPYPKPKGKATFNRTNDAVQWAWWTWNPVTGCLHGCKYCYAREMAHLPTFKAAYPTGFNPLLRVDRLDAPVNHKFPAETAEPEAKRVFVCSMADLFGAWVPDEWIEKVFNAIAEAPEFEYLFLTKNPQRYLEINMPNNAWAGTTVDSFSIAGKRLNALRAIKSNCIKWVSFEPLLEPMESIDFNGIDWVVIGARSGTLQPDGKKVPGFAPPFEWVADIVTQAKGAECAVYMKANLLGKTSDQWPGMKLVQETPCERR